MAISSITIFKSLVSYTAAAQWLNFTIAIVDVYSFAIYRSMESYFAMWISYLHILECMPWLNQFFITSVNNAAQHHCYAMKPQPNHLHLFFIPWASVGKIPTKQYVHFWSQFQGFGGIHSSVSFKMFLLLTQSSDRSYFSLIVDAQFKVLSFGKI